MTCFTSGQFISHAVCNSSSSRPRLVEGTSDVSSSAEGFPVYIVAAVRGSLTKSYPVNFLNWRQLPSPSRINTIPEPLMCVPFHSERSRRIHTPVNTTSALDSARAQDRGRASTRALRLHVNLSETYPVAHGHHTVPGQPPSQTSFLWLQLETKDTAAS